MNNQKRKYPELKPGYVVKDRTGCLYMILPSADEGLVAVDQKNSWMYVASIWDHSERYEYEIMEVYGFCRFCFKAHHISTDDRELLWKREPEKTCDNCIHKPVCNHVGTCEHFRNKV